MDRRSFLQKLLIGAAAVPLAGEVDWEQLLWTPRTLITVPQMPGALTLEALNEVTLKQIMPGVIDNIFKSNPLIRYMRDHRIADYRFSIPLEINFPSRYKL